jgi:hypothetical protein
MSRIHVKRILALIPLAIALALLLAGCGSHHKTHAHKTGECWRPAYAANPTASWAKHPSATHRHCPT